MKGLFIPEITTEMFRNGCLESIETLMAEGEIYDIDYQDPCEDCISRQALIEKATSWDKHFADSERYVSLTDIQNAPSVTPQPKILSDAEINTFIDSMKNMRKATKEENKSTVEYIDSISKPTGFLFDEAYEEIVFVETHKKLSENLQLCNDCVSREEFERRIKPYDTEDKTDKALYNFAHNTLIGCPSVTPQPKRGKWIIVDDCEHFIAKCDRCGNVIDSRILSWHPEKYAYCSSCGADMREVQDDD